MTRSLARGSGTELAERVAAPMSGERHRTSSRDRRYPSTWISEDVAGDDDGLEATPLLACSFLLGSRRCCGALALLGHQGFGKVERKDEGIELGL